MKNMSLSRVTTFAVISALAMLSLAAPLSAQQGTAPAAPSAPVAKQAPAVSRRSCPGGAPMRRRRRPNVKESF
jgi:biopolymer transport protein ExbB